MNSIREGLDRYYAKQYWDNAMTPQDYWRVSSLEMPWDAYHRRLQSPPDYVGDVVLDKTKKAIVLSEYDISRGAMVMDMGTSLHRIVQDILPHLEGIEIIGVEFDVQDEVLGVKGHPDMYIRFIENGRKILYDIKTINERAWDNMKREGLKAGLPGLMPYPHHEKQVLMYDYLEGQQADEIRLFYIDRNNGRREEIPVERDPAKLQESLDQVAFLNECWRTKTPPPVPPIGSWEMTYSNYQHLMGYNLVEGQKYTS